MKVAFLGTPSFAETVLQKLIASKHEVVAVICALDKPQGRGNVLTPPQTKVLAQKHNLKVLQYHKIKNEGVEDLKGLNCDIFVTAAFGQILSQEILDIPKYGVLNVHGSLLPKYRGPAPVQYALLNGEKTTGVTIMRTNIGIDDGDMLLKEEIAIEDTDNSETLMSKLALIGGEAIVKALDMIENSQAVFEMQNHNQATFTHMLKKENSFIDFSKDAESVVNFIRAYTPNPGAKFLYNNQEFKVFSAKIVLVEGNFEIGEVIKSSAKDGLVIACGKNAVEIIEFNPPSSKKMSAKSYLNGKKINLGENVGI